LCGETLLADQHLRGIDSTLDLISDSWLCDSGFDNLSFTMAAPVGDNHLIRRRRHCLKTID
jgi:hypothetical protein